MKYHLVNLVTGEILIYRESYENCQDKVYELWDLGHKIPFLIIPAPDSYEV